MKNILAPLKCHFIGEKKGKRYWLFLFPFSDLSRRGRRGE
jgi:hypothetical protein